MTFDTKDSFRDRDQKKFVSGKSGDTAVNTVVDGGEVSIAGPSGNVADVNVDKHLQVVLGGKVDVGNSRSDTLIADEEFNGDPTDTLDYALIFITVFADVPSAVDGCHLKVSSDGIVWRDSDSYTIPANTEKTFSFQPIKRYFKIHYINGSTNQGVFDLQVILKRVNSKPSSHRISDTISQEDDATLQKSVLTAQQPDGDFTNIGATASGNMKVSDAENGLAIAKGEVIGTSSIAKFGENPDISTATVPEDIWDFGGLYNFSTTNDIDSISSSNNSDVHEFTIIGLDINWNEVIQTKTLNGQTREALDTPLIRVYRVYNSSGVITLGDVYVYVNGTTTLGVPDTAVDVRAMVRIDHEQTMMLVYTVPAGKTAYWMGGYVSMSTTKAALAIFSFKVRNFGGVFREQNKVSTSSTGSNSFIRTPFVPNVIPEKSDVIVRCVETSTNNVGVSAGMDFILVDN